jgi:polysaccharide pyruvyl transferase WcaK-like protein
VRILVVHGWVSGNLGDVLQSTVLLEHLRSLSPSRLDLAGWPRVPAAGCEPMLAPVDHFLAERSARAVAPGAWAGLRRALRDGRFFAARTRLFRGYDVVVSAPGPFLTDADMRARMALLDLRAAHAVGRPFLFASHSIGPLGEAALRRLARADLIVAREPDTHDYLAAHGVPSHDGADLAFLFPLPPRSAAAPHAPYRLAFLRSDNLELARLRVEDGALRVGAVEVLAPASGRIVLATSDPLRDRPSLEAIAARAPGIEIRVCDTLHGLIELVAGADEIATDRYHPAVLAALAGRRLSIVAHPGWPKLRGLERLLATRDLDAIRARARAGLERVSERVLAARC